jgi:hypothetical protein
LSLFNQSELPAFFSPQQVNLKISYPLLPNPIIPKDELPRLAKLWFLSKEYILIS